MHVNLDVEGEMRWLVVCLCAMVVGCGGSSLVKYDPLKDKSSIYVSLDRNVLGGLEPGKPHLALLITGEGMHPKEWSGALFVTYHTPKGEPDFLGDRPTLVLNPGVGYARPIKVIRYTNKEKPSPSDDEVFFGVSLEALADLIEYGSIYKLNEKEFKLTPEEESGIRTAIIAAREDTNAGK